MVFLALLKSSLQKSYEIAFEPFKRSHMNTVFFWFDASSRRKRVEERIWFWMIWTPNFFQGKNQENSSICLEKLMFSLTWNGIFCFIQGLSDHLPPSYIFILSCSCVQKKSFLPRNNSRSLHPKTLKYDSFTETKHFAQKIMR